MLADRPTGFVGELGLRTFEGPLESGLAFAADVVLHASGEHFEQQHLAARNSELWRDVQRFSASSSGRCKRCACVSEEFRHFSLHRRVLMVNAALNITSVCNSMMCGV